MATIESKTQGNVGLEVDNTFSAARVSLRPLEYVGPNKVLGHYSIDVGIGSFAFNVSAGMVWFQNVDSSLLAVIHRVAISMTITSAVTTAQAINPLNMYIQRNATLPTTNATVITSSGAPDGQKIRRGMGPSVILNKGGIIVASANTGYTGQTGTIDNLNFASLAINLPGTAALGSSTGTLDMYKYDRYTSHPLILSPAEAFAIQYGSVNFASGSMLARCTIEWAEVPVF